MVDGLGTIRNAVEGRFGQGKVLVVGDLMLDVYLWGDVARISPEAPVPVVRLSRRTEVPGGAGNVCLNLAGLGMEVIAAGFVGNDEPGHRLRALLEAAGVQTRAVVPWENRPTLSKTRVIGGHQQMIRLDEEWNIAVPESDVQELSRAIEAQLDDSVRAVILSDYAKGALPESICGALIAEARRRGIPILVDPKSRDFLKYAGATVLTPNRHELEMASGRDLRDESTLREAGHRFRVELALDALVVTRGEQGISLFEERGASDFPAVAREVFDVSGAGDTVIATVAAALVAGMDLDDAVRLANIAAGIVVAKVGTTPIHRQDLLRAIQIEHVTEQAEKICELDLLAQRVAEWRSRGERVVFTNGCFDLLHVGHVQLLAKARREGDRLVVGLNSDRSIREAKGESRPVVTQGDRQQILASLACVDAVVIFDEETPLRLVERLRPDVLVKGGDYIDSQIVGAAEVKSWGGTIVIIPLVEGRSTTKTISKAAAGF